MNYYQDDKHRIQADMAYRIGKICLQYEQIPQPPKTDFAITLNLCLLQNLLTHCIELLDQMSKPKRRALGLSVKLGSDATWGLDQIEIIRNTFEDNLTVAQFLRHIRNGLSHPTGTDKDSSFSSTGYNSLKDDHDNIRALFFSSSPDTKKNQPKRFDTLEKAEAYLDKHVRGAAKKSYGNVTAAPNEDGTYGLYQEGKTFARQFSCVLTCSQIKNLVLGLSNLLAQPVIKHWDGETITNIIAA
jgi:hypothetical protein